MIRGPLVLRDHLAGDRHQDAVELGPHHVLELEPAGALPELHRLVVGQVDGDGLGARVGVARVVEGVVCVEVGVRARALALVGLRHREPALQRGEERRVACQPRAPGLVLEQDVRLGPGLLPEQAVDVGLDRADDHIDPVGLHVEPRQVARLILVGFEGPGAKLEIPPEAGVVGERRRLPELGGCPAHGRGVDLVVGDGHEPSGTVPAHDGVLSAEGAARRGRGVGGSLELLGGQVMRIELRAGGALARAGDERPIPIEPVPRAVVDLDEAACRGVLERSRAASPGQGSTAAGRRCPSPTRPR